MADVMCVETGKIFKTVREAAEMTGASVRGIYNSCKNPKYTSGCYHWIFTTGRPVLQLDLEGNVINRFSSVKKASEYIGSNHVLLVLQGKRKICKGYRWEYC